MFHLKLTTTLPTSPEVFWFSRAKTTSLKDAHRALTMLRSRDVNHLAEQSPLFFAKIAYFLQATERHVWDKCSQSGGKHLSKELWARKCLWMGLSLQKVRQFGPKPLPHMQNSKLLCMAALPNCPQGWENDLHPSWLVWGKFLLYHGSHGQAKK